MILAFLLEERSAKEMLKGLLPRLLPAGVEVKYVVFEGKQDLKHQMTRRLRHWPPETIFVVMCDQDSSDCLDLKAELVEKCPEATRDHLIVRIICRELESWYFGDLAAVEDGLNMTGLVNKYKNKRKYRIPDKIGSPAEELENITQGIYQKVSGSRKIGSKLSLDSNTSKSFQVFIDSIQGMVRDGWDANEPGRLWTSLPSG